MIRLLVTYTLSPGTAGAPEDIRQQACEILGSAGAPEVELVGEHQLRRRCTWCGTTAGASAMNLVGHGPSAECKDIQACERRMGGTR